MCLSQFFEVWHQGGFYARDDEPGLVGLPFYHVGQFFADAEVVLHAVSLGSAGPFSLSSSFLCIHVILFFSCFANIGKIFVVRKSMCARIECG